MFTDLVGLSSWAVGDGDEKALPLLRRVASAVERSWLTPGGTSSGSVTA